MFQEREEAEEELRAEEERKPGRDRVREMIAAAHRDDASLSNSDEGDDVTRRGTMRESKTISEEMAKLATEEDR